MLVVICQVLTFANDTSDWQASINMQKDLHKIIDGADKWQMDQVNAKLCIGKTNLKCLL